MKRLCAALGLAVALFSCARPPEPASQPHYVLGGGYQAGGAWYYPQASYSAVQTGLATVYADGHAKLTSDGEKFDQHALAAAHQTLQLPAIARLTNLESGRQVLVRINDRGPAAPGRLVAVTRRTAELLAFPPSGIARVRLEILPAESHAAAEAVGGAPDEQLALTAAPRETVQASDLPPPGAAPSAPPRLPQIGSGSPLSSAAAAPPLRLPERVTQTAPEAGSLWIEMGSFSRREFAERQRARASGLNPSIERVSSGRSETYHVRLGPLGSVAQADAELAKVLRAGISDARIVVE